MDYIRTKEAVGNCRITDRMIVYNSFAVRIKGTKKGEIHGLFLMTLKNRLIDDIGAVRDMKENNKSKMP